MIPRDWSETYLIERDGTTCLVAHTKYFQQADGTITTEKGANGIEVDKIIGTNKNDDQVETYDIKMGMATKKSRQQDYADQNGNTIEGTRDSYYASSKAEAQSFLEFTQSVTGVEFAYAHLVSDNAGNYNYLDLHLVSTLSAEGASLSTPGWVSRNSYNKVYDLHTHPSGESMPSGIGTTHPFVDIKAATHPSDAIY